MIKEEVSKEVLLDGAQMGLSVVLVGTMGFLKEHSIPIEDWVRYIGESFEGALGELQGEPLDTVMECCQSAKVGHFETEHMSMVTRGVSAP